MLAALLALAFARDLDVVEHVDLQRYQGTWYEVARLPNRFQKGCAATTATYTLRDDGRVDVLNRCSAGSGERAIRGTAKAIDSSNARLRVRFFGPFGGRYQVLALGDDYEYAVVGEPRRRYLWVLSRAPTMDPAVLDALIHEAEQQGYDTTELLVALRPTRSPGA